MTDTTTTIAAPSAPTTTITETTTAKPGWKTTEFWLGLAAKLLGGAYAAGLIGDGTTVARVAGLAVVVLAYLGYSVARGMAKSGGAALLLACFVLASTQLACDTGRARAAAGVGAFLQCEAPHVDANLLAEAKRVMIDAVGKWISGDGHTDTAGLKSAAGPLKSDLMRCAFDGAVAALATPAPKNPSAPLAAGLEVDGAELRAKAAVIRAELGWPAQAPGG